MVEIDTISVREAGKDLISLSNDFRENIRTTFLRMNNMSGSTGEWVGHAATKFSVIANMDLPQYYRFAQYLASYGKHLVSTAEVIESLARNVRYR